MITTKLKTAYYWTCENCGRNNFEIPVIPKLTEDEAEDAYRQFNDLEPWSPLPDDWRNFELVSSPNFVTCCGCGITCETEH